MNTYRADLHVHTCASPDGRSDLHRLAQAAKKAGLDAIAITDHDLCTDCPQELYGVLMIPGCEISTKAGHITGLFLKEPIDFNALGYLPEPEDAVAAIHCAGGLAVLAHPFKHPGTKSAQFQFCVDAVETANSRAWMKVPEANELAKEFAQLRALPQVGGSDAHDFVEVGNALTLLEAPHCDPDLLRQALANGDSTAVILRNTSHWRKGLSLLTKALRKGPVWKMIRAVIYLVYCAMVDLVCALRRTAS